MPLGRPAGHAGQYTPLPKVGRGDERRAELQHDPVVVQEEAVRGALFSVPLQAGMAGTLAG